MCVLLSWSHDDKVDEVAMTTAQVTLLQSQICVLCEYIQTCTCTYRPGRVMHSNFNIVALYS